jgi:hypothetical protein
MRTQMQLIFDCFHVPTGHWFECLTEVEHDKPRGKTWAQKQLEAEVVPGVWESPQIKQVLVKRVKYGTA